MPGLHFAVLPKKRRLFSTPAPLLPNPARRGIIGIPSDYTGKDARLLPAVKKLGSGEKAAAFFKRKTKPCDPQKECV